MIARFLNLIASPAEPEFDRLARLAGHIANADYAHVCFNNGTQLFAKAQDGLPLPQSQPLHESLCGNTIATNIPLVIEDLSIDARLQSRELHHQYGLSSYVGVPIRWTNGQAVGTVAAIARNKGSVTERVVAALQECANLVSRELLIRQAATDEVKRSSPALAPLAAAAPDLVRAITRNHLSVLRSVSDGVIAVRGDGVINFVNPAAEKLLTRSADSILGATFAQVFDVSATGQPLKDVACPVAASLRDGKERVAKRAYGLGADRGIIAIEYAVSPVNARVATIGAVVVFRRLSGSEGANGVALRLTLREVSKLKEQIARLSAVHAVAEPTRSHDLPGVGVPSTKSFEDLLRVIDREHADQSVRARALSVECDALTVRSAALAPHSPAQSLPRIAETARSRSRVGRWLES